MKPIPAAVLGAVMCLSIGAALGVVVVDDHPNAQKLEIATLTARVQEDKKVIDPMIGPCMKFLSQEGIR